jgi:hypothetical protein
MPRTLLASLLALVAALLLVACTAPEPAPSASAVSPAASASDAVASVAPALVVQRTAEVETYRFRLEVAFEGSGPVAGPWTQVMEGQVDRPSEAFHVVLDASSLVEAMERSGLGSDGGGMLGDGHMEFMETGGRVYLRMPMMAGMLGVTTPWLSAPAGMANLMQGFDLARMLDAGELLAFFETAAEFEVVGSEQVRGAATVHYRAVVDLAASPGETLTWVVRSGTTQDLEPVPVDVWIDADARIRRLSLAVQLPSTPASVVSMDDAGNVESHETQMGGGRQTYTLEFFALNEPVAIVPPDASEVTRWEDLGGLLDGGAPGGGYEWESDSESEPPVLRSGVAVAEATAVAVPSAAPIR